MTLREIQNLTLNLARGLDGIDRRLRRRSERFLEEFKRLETPEQAYGFRASGVPVGEEIRLERVFREDNLYETWHDISMILGDHKSTLPFPYWGESWRPMLRSARNEQFGGSSELRMQMYREIHCDGLVEIGFVDSRVVGSGMRSGPSVNCEWPVTAFANLLVWANRIRRVASAPTAEVAIDVELYVRGGSVSFTGYRVDGYSAPYGLTDTESISIRYPGQLLGDSRYSMGDQDEIPDLIVLFERDLWNSHGVDVGEMEGNFVIEDWDQGTRGES